MATIAQVHKRFQNFDVYGEAMATLVQLDTQVLDLNRKQLIKGKTKKGKTLKKYKSARYGKQKHKQNPQAGLNNPDLFLEGKFHKRLRLIPKTKRVYDILSEDDKAVELEKKYGSYIYGLSGDSIQTLVRGHYEAKYINRARRVLKL